MDTREQLLAQALDRHLSVMANAGSGKTHVLVSRFLNLILNDVDPKHITAITFTRKAAGEMLLKATRKIDEMIIAETEETKLKKFKKIREQLTNARISTIHSFCSGLLRDYPIEAGVNPNFIELSATDLIRIKEDTITAILEGKLEGDKPAERENVKKLFSYIGSNRLPEYIMGILNKREIFEDVDSIYSEGYGAFLEKRNSLIIELLKPHIDKIINTCRETLFKDLAGVKLIKKKEGFFEDSKKYIQECKKLYEYFEKSNDFDTFSYLLEELAHLKESFMLSNGLKSRFHKELGDSKKTHEANSLGDSFNLIKDFSDSFKNNQFEQSHFELAASLFSIVNEVNDDIDKEKGLLDAIDFDDMLIKTEELLRDSVVRQKIRRKIKYLLVDEFQDTNSLQYKIIKHITGFFENDVLFSDTANLFIVGDGKQSIYGFRNADIRVFNQAAKDIKGINGKLLESGSLSEIFILPHTFTQEQRSRAVTGNQDEMCGDIRLSASFRMKAIPAAFINHVCRKIMKKESEFDVDYDELVCARGTDLFFENPQEEYDFTADKAQGSVSILLSKEYSADSDNTSLTQEELIARWILKTIKENPSYNFASIAILSRTSDFNKLVNVFLKNKIPFVRHSGAGFFKAQEIKDIGSYLKFLHNPADNLALASVLRSPFFNISDADIFYISRQKNASSFWEKLQDITEKEEKNNETSNLSRVFKILNKSLSLSSKLSISRIITEIIESTGYLGVIASSPRRLQIMANIEKIKKLGRNFEAKGFKNLFDFVEEIQLMESSETKESEAAIITDANAVNIMTIHAAKGLEFPITILYNLNKKLYQNTNNYNISSELGVTFSYNTGIYDKNYDKYVDMPSFTLTKKLAKMAEQAELKRLFYVAMTRAKDHLVLTSNIKINKDGEPTNLSGFLKMLNETIELQIRPGEDDSMMILPDKLTVLRGSKERTVNVKIGMDIIHTIEEQSFSPQERLTEDYPLQERQSTDMPMTLLETIQPTMNKEFYSPSRLMLFEKQPRTYLEQYIFGFKEEIEEINENIRFTGNSGEAIPIDNKELIDVDNAQNLSLMDSGAVSGTIIHSILEKFKNWYQNGKIDESKLESMIKKELDFSPAGIDKVRVYNRAKQEIKNVFSTKLINEYKSRFDTAKTEMTLTMPLDKDFIHGKIDLLLKNPSGFYEIWDWKSNIVESHEKFHELSAYYKPQMKFYAYLLMHLHPEYNEYKARLLFTRLASAEAVESDWTSLFMWNKKELNDYENMIKKSIFDIEQLSFEPVINFGL